MNDIFVCKSDADIMLEPDIRNGKYYVPYSDLFNQTIKKETEQLEKEIFKDMKPSIFNQDNPFMSALLGYESATIKKPVIDHIIFDKTATIVFWKDGTKTVVKCMDGDAFDPEKGVLMAFYQKVMGGSKTKTNKEFKKLVSDAYSASYKKMQKKLEKEAKKHNKIAYGPVTLTCENRE